MKRETLEKIRNILEHLFELFIFILIMLITFGSLSVHAEESNVQQELTGKVTVSVVNDYYGYDGVVTYEFKNNVNLDNYEVCGFLNTSTDSIVPSVTSQSIDFLCKNKMDGKISLFSDAVIITNVSTTGNVEPKYQVGSVLQSFNNDQSRKKVDGNIVWYKFYEYEGGTYPVAKDNASAQNYLLTGDTSGIINGGGSIDNPDFEDSAYAFTGFTANNKMTASWTGTTERSYLKDQKVDEYVRVNYYFADKEAQDTIKQADSYPNEFATADKTLTIDVSGLKPDDENWFLRYIRITPCYRQAGLGAWGDFYHGSDVYVYFDVKGNIEKVIQKSKPTDLNKGNMVYDSSIGYLQNVIYTEQKTHDGSGRQATFKWSTLKSLPDDAQIEIVAQNFYIEWFNKKTEENFIYKEYGEDCFYSAGSYSFNANTPVWTWLKEKEIDPFSIKTQSYGSTEYYLRIVVYNDSDSLYHYGGWVKVDIKSKDTTIMPSTDVETGGFDDSSGLWNQDTASSDSYHYSTDDKGNLTGNIDVNSWEDLNMNSFTWMYRNMQSMVSSLGEFPAMVNAVFGYLPVQYITSIGVLLVAIVLLRFMGR